MRNSSFLMNFNLMLLCLKQQYGRKFLLLPFATLPWLVYKFVMLLESGQLEYRAINAQNELIGLPLCLLAIWLGIGIVAREIEACTLETTYTLAHEARLLWYMKLFCAGIILLLSEALLALVSYAVFTDFPISLLYRSMQSAVFFLVLAMGLGALFRNQIVAAMVSIAVLVFLYNLMTVNYISPMFNPLELDLIRQGETQLMITQNYLLTQFLVFIFVGLTFKRIGRREVLLN